MCEIVAAVKIGVHQREKVVDFKKYTNRNGFSLGRITHRNGKIRELREEEKFFLYFFPPKRLSFIIKSSEIREKNRCLKFKKNHHEYNQFV